MINVVYGDMFEGNDECIVNPVNCIGVSGAGVAKQFRSKFPVAQDTYVRMCDNGEMVPGFPKIIESGRELPNSIVLFPTKDHWEKDSRIEWIDNGLYRLSSIIEDVGITTLGMPMVGAGLGGLDGEKVLEVIRYHLDNDITINVYQLTKKED